MTSYGVMSPHNDVSQSVTCHDAMTSHRTMPSPSHDDMTCRDAASSHDSPTPHTGMFHTMSCHCMMKRHYMEICHRMVTRHQSVTCQNEMTCHAMMTYHRYIYHVMTCHQVTTRRHVMTCHQLMTCHHAMLLPWDDMPSCDDTSPSDGM